MVKACCLEQTLDPQVSRNPVFTEFIQNPKLIWAFFLNTKSMSITLNIILAILGGLFLGVVVMRIIQQRNSNNRIKKSEQQAKRIIKKAHQESDRIKKDKMLQAKERFIELKAEHEKVVFTREKKINDIEKRLREKENSLKKE